MVHSEWWIVLIIIYLRHIWTVHYILYCWLLSVAHELNELKERQVPRHTVIHMWNEMKIVMTEMVIKWRKKKYLDKGQSFSVSAEEDEEGKEGERWI